MRAVGFCKIWILFAKIEKERQLGRSFIERINNNGSNVVPCGIPQVRNLLSESEPFTKHFWLQCRSKGNITGGARERRRREPLEGSGGMLPQKILKARGLEMLFPAFSKSDM